MICFLALILYRVLRLRLKDRGSPYSPERALEIARRIQHHKVTLHQRQSASGSDHAQSRNSRSFFDTIGLPTPTANAL